jgi:hypothetical protein
MTLIAASDFLQVHVDGLAAPPVHPGLGLDLRRPLVWTVEGVLSAVECRALIARVEALGVEPAPITTAAGFVMRPEIRNNTRAVFDDPALASDLFQRLRAAGAVPPQLNDGERAVGANERFRAYRYDVGQRFAPHYDGAFYRGSLEQSRITAMVYLNEGFLGGETAFLDYGLRVQPKAGMALLFQHRLLHEGCAVRSGTKLVVRSDVMYRRPGQP